jgi:predicted DNA-binding transcriptional regulator AlpA
MRRADRFLFARFARPSRTKGDVSMKRPKAKTKPDLVAVAAKKAAVLSQLPVRLMNRHEVCALANVSYPSVWVWMRDGKFPRSRIVGGRSMWLSTDIDAWLVALPVRPLKGDPAPVDAPPQPSAV